MLRFAKDPDRLYFTTTMQNAVQAYDLEHDRLLDPVSHHPSPPTVFAISATSHLLLSTSVLPPVIQLANLLLQSRSLLLRPQCSSAAVVLVEFHPERGNVFILAFADATCAVYDAASIFRGGSRGERGSGVSGSGNGCEISNIKNLHEPGKATSNAPGSNPDAKQSVWVVAAGFVPSHNATVVTVGSDGRCCVVDFAATETNKASLICAWDTTGSPTSLSVLSPNPEYGLELPIARLRSRESTHRNNVVAIGCQDGKVLFFDLAGNLLFQQPLGSNGHRVIDVEWLEGDDWSEPSATRPAPNDTSKGRSRNKRKSIGEVLASGRPVAEEVLAIIDDPNAEQESEKALKKALPTGGSPSGSGADRANPAEDDAKMRWVNFPSLTRRDLIEPLAGNPLLSVIWIFPRWCRQRTLRKSIMRIHPAEQIQARQVPLKIF